jgi:ribosomal protein S27AE
MNDIELFARLNGRLYRLVPVAEGKKTIKAVRNCLQCGSVFIPVRKDKKFCAGKCRAAYSREKRSGLWQTHCSELSMFHGGSLSSSGSADIS